MGGAHRRSDPRVNAERPAFDEVARGYDPHQVDDYVTSLWRYASEVTARAAAAEAALERERREKGFPADRPAGERIGRMLALAQQEADQITGAARRIAERALEEAVADAATNSPVIRQAHEQAERLLADAFEEAERRAKAREEEVNAQLGHTTARLEVIRHQQGEILGALLRLRGLLTSDEIDRSLADLARAATGEGPPTVGGPPPHQAAGPAHQQAPRAGAPVGAGGAGGAAGRGGPAAPGPRGPGGMTPPGGTRPPRPRVPNRPPPPPPTARPPGPPPGPVGPEDDIIDAEIVEE